jgi:hypothetical protein
MTHVKTARPSQMGYPPSSIRRNREARARDRAALTPAEILAELSYGRGTQWDSAVVDAALDLVDAGEIALVVDEDLALAEMEAA